MYQNLDQATQREIDSFRQRIKNIARLTIQGLDDEGVANSAEIIAPNFKVQ